MNATIKETTSLIFAVASTIASAATTIHVDSVTQRWPWNNKVDITYTVTDGQDISSSKFYKIMFTTVIDGTTYTIDGSTLGASANTGTQTATWLAPMGLKCANCTMSAAIYDADVPSGDDYMIVDLTSGAVTYEGLYASQSASNDRYNTATYKTEKLAMRKVPAGGPYQVLKDGKYKPTNTTSRAYYIGIFPVTQRQYELVGADAGSTPSNHTGDNLRPVERISYSELRTDIASTSSIPLVATADTGTFFQRLCYKTGNKLAFDLPTDVMFAIAARAGVKATYYWDSDTADSSKFVCNENSGGHTIAVGSYPANAWGLYDVNGNVWERGRDNFQAVGFEYRIHARDPLVPYFTSETCHTWLGGAYNTTYTSDYFKLVDYCAGDAADADARKSYIGFRVSVIME